MTPYATWECGELWHCDCREGLREVADGSVDLIATDPPYGVSVSGSTVKRNRGLGDDDKINLDFGEWDRALVPWESYMPDVVRVLTPCGVYTSFLEKLEVGIIGRWLKDEQGCQVRNIGVWVKPNPAPQMRKLKWQIGIEMFLVATRNFGSGHHFNTTLSQSPDWKACPNNQPDKQHPTQKPLKIMRWIVSYWSFPGDLILDPFAGSGSTLVAAIREGRRFLGMEISEEYCEMARQRIEKELAQPTLAFDPAPARAEQGKLGLGDD